MRLARVPLIGLKFGKETTQLLDLGRGGNVNTPVTLALGIIINRVETLELVKHIQT